MKKQKTIAAVLALLALSVFLLAWQRDLLLPALADPVDIEFTRTIEGYIDERPLFSEPMAAATDGKGRIFVTDALHHSIKVLDTVTGDFITEFGQHGTNAGEINRPYGIAVSGETVYVAQLDTPRVQAFDTNGNFIAVILDNDNPGEAGHFVPTALAAGKNGELYIADVYQHRIIILDDQGQYTGSIGNYGKEPGTFSYPNGLAVDKAGNLYVADSNNRRIQVFTPSGEFLSSFDGSLGKEAVALSLPRGIALDGKNRIWVVDTLSNALAVYDRHGNLLGRHGRLGLDKGDLYFPNGLAIDEKGNIYVVEMSGSRLSVFSAR